MNERETNATRALLGLSPQSTRPISAASLAILGLCGSPYYAVLMEGAAVQPTALDVLLFAWVHDAPWDEVVSTVSTGDNERIRTAALQYGADLPPHAVSEKATHIAEEFAAAQSAMAAPVDEDQADSKNGPRHLH